MRQNTHTSIAIKATLLPCYLCGKKTVSPLFNKLDYTILKCSNCSLLSLDFDKEYTKFLKTYYRKGYFTGNKKLRAYANYADDRPNIETNASKLLKKARKYVKNGNVLDIGCAMGFFMDRAEKHGFTSYGVEVSDYASQIAQKQFKKRIFKGSVEEFIKNGNKLPEFSRLTFDLITLSDIIEHVKDPRGVLTGLKTVLKPNGVITIQTGDVSSIWATLMGKNWHFYAPPQHLYFFSKKTLKTLLEQAGYEVLSINKVGKHVSLRYVLHMTQYMNIPYIGDYLQSVVSSNIIGKLSIPIKLFDNMIVFAKKKDK